MAAPALGSPEDSRIELTASTIAWSERERFEYSSMRRERSSSRSTAFRPPQPTIKFAVQMYSLSPE